MFFGLCEFVGATKLAKARKALVDETWEDIALGHGKRMKGWYTADLNHAKPHVYAAANYIIT